jgi:hypothetical protein
LDRVAGSGFDCSLCLNRPFTIGPTIGGGAFTCYEHAAGVGLADSRLSEKEGALILLLSIFGVTAGTILGTYFRVLVLVPVIFFAAAIIVAAGFVNGFSVSTFLVALFVMQASLEFGYLAGCFGAAYVPGRIKSRYASRLLTADAIALATLGTAVIVFAVFYELNSGHNGEPTAAGPNNVLPAVSGKHSNAAKLGGLHPDVSASTLGGFSPQALLEPPGPMLVVLPNVVMTG